jgi:hypothetical protein
MEPRPLGDHRQRRRPVRQPDPRGHILKLANQYT